MVQRMVDYFYKGTYEINVDPNGQPCDTGILSTHATMFALGNKYLVEGLMTLAAKEYQAALRNDTGVCDFLLCLTEVYQLTDENETRLRNVALCYARENLASSLGSPETKEIFDRVADKVPEFAKHLLDSYLEQPLLGRCHGCGRDHLVPVECLQCRCKKCGRGGATPWNPVRKDNLC